MNRPGLIVNLLLPLIFAFFVALSGVNEDNPHDWRSRAEVCTLDMRVFLFMSSLDDNKYIQFSEDFMETLTKNIQVTPSQGLTVESCTIIGHPDTIRWEEKKRAEKVKIDWSTQGVALRVRVKAQMPEIGEWTLSFSADVDNIIKRNLFQAAKAAGVKISNRKELETAAQGYKLMLLCPGHDIKLPRQISNGSSVVIADVARIGFFGMLMHFFGLWLWGTFVFSAIIIFIRWRFTGSTGF